MQTKLEQLKRQVSEAAGRRAVYVKKREAKKQEQKALEKRLRIGQASIYIVMSVGEALQRRVSLRLSSIATHLLATTFQHPYSVEIPFTPSGRGSIEASILFHRAGRSFRPVLPSGQLLAGGGPVEAAAFGLRCALWGQLRPRPRPIFFQDEPFRFLQKDLIPVMAEVLSQVSKKMGLQILMVTHEPEFSDNADNVVEV